jgi:hypothetical protein
MSLVHVRENLRPERLVFQSDPLAPQTRICGRCGCKVQATREGDTLSWVCTDGWRDREWAGRVHGSLAFISPYDLKPAA